MLEGKSYQEFLKKVDQSYYSSGLSSGVQISIKENILGLLEKILKKDIKTFSLKKTAATYHKVKYNGNYYDSGLEIELGESSDLKALYSALLPKILEDLKQEKSFESLIFSGVPLTSEIVAFIMKKISKINKLELVLDKHEGVLEVLENLVTISKFSFKRTTQPPYGYKFKKEQYSSVLELEADKLDKNICIALARNLPKFVETDVKLEGGEEVIDFLENAGLSSVKTVRLAVQESQLTHQCTIVRNTRNNSYYNSNDSKDECNLSVSANFQDKSFLSQLMLLNNPALTTLVLSKLSANSVKLFFESSQKSLYKKIILEDCKLDDAALVALMQWREINPDCVFEFNFACEFNVSPEVWLKLVQYGNKPVSYTACYREYCQQGNYQQSPSMHYQVFSHNLMLHLKMENIDFFQKTFCPLFELQSLSLYPEVVSTYIDKLNDFKFLHILNMSHCGIDNTGLINLSKQLKSNTTVGVLDLSGNPLSSEGLLHLAEALQEKPYIYSLSLSNIQVDEAGVKKFLELLEKNDVKAEISIDEKYSYPVRQKVKKINDKVKGAKDELLKATRDGKPSEVKTYLDKRVSPYITDSDGNSLMHIAIKNNKLTVIRILKKYPFLFELRDREGLTPLQLAEKENKKEIIELLNAPVETVQEPTKKRQLTMFDMQQQSQNKNKQQKTSETQPMQVDEVSEDARLMVALLNGDIETVQKNKAQIEKLKTALHLAVRSRNEKLLFMLLQWNLDVNAEDTEKNTPLHIACELLLPEMIERLLVAKANSNLKNKLGLTPLYITAGGFYEHKIKESEDNDRAGLIAKLLLQYGADEKVVIQDYQINDNQMTALHKAANTGRSKVAKAILNHGKVNVNQKNQKGETVLKIAADNNDTLLVDRLLIEPEIVLDVTSNNTEISEAISKRKKLMVPHREAGFVWSKNFSVHYKDCVIDSKDMHATLQQAGDKNQKGNQVAANLILVVSNKEQPNVPRKRRTIRVDLDFVEKLHVTDRWKTKEGKRSPDAKDRTLKRFEDAPDFIKANATENINQKNKPLNKEGIANLYKTNIEPANGKSYELRYHHGEAGFLDDLENPETLNKIAEKVSPQLKPGDKLEAVICNINSKFYLCKDCEISLLGFQNSAASNFVRLLKERLLNILQFSRIRALPIFTFFSATVPMPGESPKQNAEGHSEYTVDLRGQENKIGFCADTQVIKPAMTAYNSRKQN